MKRYADYTKDDLMRLLESLTPGGSEFHEEPETCVRYARERHHFAIGYIANARKVKTERDGLLAACEKLLARLERVDPLPEGGSSSMRDFARAAIAAAKGEA